MKLLAGVRPFESLVKYLGAGSWCRWVNQLRLPKKLIERITLITKEDRFMIEPLVYRERKKR
jgi:hypothetical protein